MTTLDMTLDKVRDLLSDRFCAECEKTKCNNECSVYRALTAVDGIEEEAMR